LTSSETHEAAAPEPVPRVSIGLPVFDGERYLAKTIDSILGQSFTDLELIISDNASTDRTGEICEEYARRDGRVRYFRNARNLGAGPNYDGCFHRARGTYFKWAAHDDSLAPDYLAKAVAALDAAPDAVLCTVGIQEIGPDDQKLRTYANSFPGVTSADPAERFAAVIHARHQCEDFFGLYRRAALVGSGLHDNYSGSDRVLLAEMALRGPWVSVPDPLFLHREHEGRYTRAILLQDRRLAALWQDTTVAQESAAATERRGAKPPSTQFHLVVYRKYLHLVRKNVHSLGARAACYRELARWWLTDGHLPDVLRDLLGPYPGVRQGARSVKRFVLGKRDAPPVPGSLPTLK
jgi:glycosyltransferase involved in cell wall biosynthesis